MTEPAAPLVARDLVLRYGARAVIDGVSIAPERGCWTALVGANGSGKSTLLRALAGLMRPAAGTVLLDGIALGQWRRRERARKIAWLAQGGPWPDHLTVDACVALGRFASTGWLGTPDAADREAVDAALRLTGAEGIASRRMGTLSGGERQRALLARALAAETPVLLLDEPTTFLDPPHQVDVARLMQRVARERGVSVVAAIHDLNLALAADRIAVLREGRLVGIGPVDEALDRDWLAQAFGQRIEVARVGGARLWHPGLTAGP